MKKGGKGSWLNKVVSSTAAVLLQGELAGVSSGRAPRSIHHRQGRGRGKQHCILPILLEKAVNLFWQMGLWLEKVCHRMNFLIVGMYVCGMCSSMKSALHLLFSCCNMGPQVSSMIPRFSCQDCSNEIQKFWWYSEWFQSFAVIIIQVIWVMESLCKTGHSHNQHDSCVLLEQS